MRGVRGGAESGAGGQPSAVSQIQIESWGGRGGNRRLIRVDRSDALR
jgi:hypothetical protein